MRRLAQLALALGILAILVAGSALALFQALILRDLPALYSLTDYRPNLITTVRSADGQIFARFYRERREVVAIERIPQHVVNAFVASEDDSFYEHEGLDYPGILRAAFANLRAGEIKQGGSTITQQVAKTFLLSNERSWVRKLKDMVLAQRIEEHLNKNEILYLYLNQIYLGSGAYGVQAAARTYFGKSVEELTLAEAALIAGVVPAPSRYTPFRSRELARTRQRFVLGRMVESGYIREEERAAALEEPLELLVQAPDQLSALTAYFGEEVRRYLFEKYGSSEVLTGGLDVVTTLDLKRQQVAYESVREGLEAHDRRYGYRGPLRVVPEEETQGVLDEIARSNGTAPWTPGTVLRALVVGVDDAKGIAQLDLGEGRTTALTLEDVEWARTPNTEIDGWDYKLNRLSRALRAGYLVELRMTGELAGDDEHPAASEPALHDAAGEPVPVPRFALYEAPLAEGALISMDVNNGEVQALVGGYSFERSQFNRAVQSRRQPGSAFKPIVYAAALEQSYTPASIVYDTALVYEDRETGLVWKPENYSEQFYGPITLREALAHSRNTATIRIMREIGIPPVVRMARQLGIEGPLEHNLSMALGASEVTLAELVRAYATFAASGRRVDPIFVREVRDRDGELLETSVPLLWSDSLPAEAAEPALAAEPVDGLGESMLEPELGPSKLRNGHGDLPEGYAIDPVTAYLMTDLLQAVVQEGTGFRARALGRPIAGKTGTTNDMYDAWFIGFTPSLVTGVWVGYDNARTLGRNETGSRAASPIFVDYMGKVLAGQPSEHFRAPPGIMFARIDKKTGLLAPAGRDYVFQPFREGTAPSEFSNTTELTGGARPRLD